MTDVALAFIFEFSSIAWIFAVLTYELFNGLFKVNTILFDSFVDSRRHGKYLTGNNFGMWWVETLK